MSSSSNDSKQQQQHHEKDEEQERLNKMNPLQSTPADQARPVGFEDHFSSAGEPSSSSSSTTQHSNNKDGVSDDMYDALEGAPVAPIVLPTNRVL
ncbi:hypothetical protein RI367_003755 [Sorochytrium milnesiophthora]